MVRCCRWKGRLVQVSALASERLHYQPPTVIYHVGSAGEESQPQQGADPGYVSLNKVTAVRFVSLISLVNKSLTKPLWIRLQEC